MLVPTSYTAPALAAYMEHVLSDVGTLLGWAAADGDYDEAVTDALLLLGGSDITEYTTAAEIRQLRAAARLAAWQHATDALAAKHDIGADGQDLSLSQLKKHAGEQLAAAQAAADRLGIGADDVGAMPPVGVVAVVRHQDPYATLEESDRTWP